jgi:hypothetical protein
MIVTESPFDALAERLTDKAQKLAEARAETKALALRKDPRRWRRSGLLWPLFAKG